MRFFYVKFDPKKTVFLIDGSSFLYRAYYGLRPLHTITGEPVQAVYSFVRMIKKIITTFSPEYIALVWDSKGKTTRHEMYPDYKATRQAPPSDIFDQKKHIVEFAKLIGLHQVEQQGIEADDLMYSLAVERSKEGDQAVFITSDKDMGQALSSHILIFDPFKDVIVDEQAFKEKMGFGREKLPFYFALLGDASDNIPGVKGIGKKGALDLVTQFESLEDMYNNLDKISKPRTCQLLEEQKDNAFLSQKLFLLQYHPSNLTKEALSFDARNWDNARPLFQSLNFTSLLKDISGDTTVQQHVTQASVLSQVPQYNYQAVTTAEQLDALIALIKEKKLVAIDTETDGLDSLGSALVGSSYCVEEGTAYYVPCGHKTDEQQLSREYVIAALKPILEDQTIAKYFHNAKFDQEVFYNNGIMVQGVVFDTMIGAHLALKEWQSAGLKNLSQYYLNEPMLSFKEVVKDNKYKDFSYVPISLATSYAAADAHQTFRIQPHVAKDLKDEKLLTFYEQIEGPLVQLLFKMEIEGIAVDEKLLKELGIKVDSLIAHIEKEILDMIGDKHAAINLNSPRQVEQLLFVDLQLPPQKKSAKGTGYSTDHEVLEILAQMHPVPALLIKYRELFKLKTTYIDALPEYINKKTGKIHTSYLQIATSTGRLSSADPNLQNIPVTGIGSYIREAFKPRPGELFLSADYSQIELRVLAHLSRDENLVSAFLSGHDIHAETAARLFDVPLNAVTSEQRQLGKRINFSILYGLTPYGLSKDLHIPFKDAKIYIERYFAQYPQVRTWMDGVIEQTKKDGYVTTHWGRRRYIPGIYERNKSLFEEACRIAVNTAAQGTAAEIMKIGMLSLDQAIQKEGLQVAIILQIHDELLLSVAPKDKTRVEQLVKETLENVVKWQVPLVVNTRFGAHWKEVSK